MFGSVLRADDCVPDLETAERIRILSDGGQSSASPSTGPGPGSGRFASRFAPGPSMQSPSGRARISNLTNFRQASKQSVSGSVASPSNTLTSQPVLFQSPLQPQAGPMPLPTNQCAPHHHIPHGPQSLVVAASSPLRPISLPPKLGFEGASASLFSKPDLALSGYAAPRIVAPCSDPVPDRDELDIHDLERYPGDSNITSKVNHCWLIQTACTSHVRFIQTRVHELTSLFIPSPALQLQLTLWTLTYLVLIAFPHCLASAATRIGSPIRITSFLPRVPQPPSRRQATRSCRPPKCPPAQAWSQACGPTTRNSRVGFHRGRASVHRALAQVSALCYTALLQVACWRVRAVE